MSCVCVCMCVCVCVCNIGLYRHWTILQENVLTLNVVSVNNYIGYIIII